MAAAFHLFELLPLELRQRVWKLTMEPRRVPVGDFKSIVTWTAAPPRPPHVLPPAVLHACVESRSYLERYYVKAFAKVSTPRHTLINFDMGTVCMRQETVIDFFVEFPVEFPRIKHLSIDTKDCDF